MTPRNPTISCPSPSGNLNGGGFRRYVCILLHRWFCICIKGGWFSKSDVLWSLFLQVTTKHRSLTVCNMEFKERDGLFRVMFEETQPVIILLLFCMRLWFFCFDRSQCGGFFSCHWKKSENVIWPKIYLNKNKGYGKGCNDTSVLLRKVLDSPLVVADKSA